MVSNTSVDTANTENMENLPFKPTEYEYKVIAWLSKSHKKTENWPP